MPRQLKQSALLLTGLMVLLCLFFEVSKHNPGFSRINPFGEDPYDAGGSFAVQFAPLTALLALLRAFRPYHRGGLPESQRRLLARTIFLGLAAICVTLLTDAIALGRHFATWSGTSAGMELAAWTCGFGLLAAGAVFSFCRSQQVSFRASGRGLALLSACVALLALYPEYLRHTVLGALFTAMTGSTLFFVMVWAASQFIAPERAQDFADALDDFSAMTRVILSKLRFWKALSEVSSARAGLVRLDPRKHPATMAALAGVLIGALLLGCELGGEWASVPLRRLMLVSAAYLSLETAGVLMGYALLAKPLHIIRKPALSIE